VAQFRPQAALVSLGNGPLQDLDGDLGVGHGPVPNLRDFERPTDAADKSPFTAAYVRKLAREAGVPEYLLRSYPKARAELEPVLPRWREAAKAIGELGIGLDDAEYVGGVLWYGLTHHGSEGSLEEQKRVITDRLVRWGNRDAGDAAQAAGAVRSVLDDFLPGRQRPASSSLGPAATQPVRSSCQARHEPGRKGAPTFSRFAWRLMRRR
jgi:hypothetical protein